MKTQVILKNLQWLGRHNPAFTPGSVQTAVAELLNPTSSILPYSGRLCLDKPAIVCTGTKYFNIDAGATKNVNFQILMPTAEGTYPVHLDIFSNDELIEAYQAAEDVVIGVIAKYTLEVTVEPPGAGYVVKSPSKATYSAGEVVTLTAHPYSGYEFDHWGGWPPYPGVGSTSPTIQITMDADWWVVAAFREVALPKGELVMGYVWWEGQPGWLSIWWEGQPGLPGNNWPPNTAIITTWKVKNTGDESAVFKTRLLGVESAEAWLTPGASFWFEQSAFSLSPGTHQLTLQILADGQVVRQYSFWVLTVI
jgi:hypothetical protein